MNGLIILNRHEEIRAIWGIIGTIAVIIGAIAISGVFVYEFQRGQIICGCIALVFFVCAYVLFFRMPKETVVQAYMQDGVNMSEVAERYTVRDVDGLLLTLVEKEE